MNLKLAPGKIAVKKIEAKLKGGLELPVTRAKAYDIAEITHVGKLDSYGFEGKDSTAESFKPGDIVLFQLPLHLAGLASHTVKDVLTLFLNVPDIIAKLDSSLIEMKSFHIAGRYLLLKPSIRKVEGSKIIIPGIAEEMNKDRLHFSVLQIGADVKLELFTGQEVFPHRARINPIVVDNEDVCFVDQQFIDGAMVEA